MKKAFTMIELIFVIVILGILAAVALPKFVSVGQQAHEGNLKSFVGTLNRTAGAEMWAESIRKGDNGSIVNLAQHMYADWLSNYIDIPKEIDAASVDLKQCNSTTDDKVVAIADKNVAGQNYDITCRAGDATHAPVFKLWLNSGDTADSSAATITADDTHTLIQ